VPDPVREALAEELFLIRAALARGPLKFSTASSLVAAVEAALAEVDRWATLAPPDDWGESTHDTALADAGRSLRETISGALLGEGETDAV
jgi:hypothetical protein